MSTPNNFRIKNGLTVGNNAVIAGQLLIGNTTINSTSLSTSLVTATDYNSLSDINTKTNVTNITESLTLLTRINGVRFNWKDTGIPSAGLIAQEVQEIFPELVCQSENGNLTLNYNGVIGLLVEAIKELSSRIDKLESI